MHRPALHNVMGRRQFSTTLDNHFTEAQTDMRRFVTAIALVLGFAASAAAQSASFVNISEARGGQGGFSAVLTQSFTPNVLTLGLDSGFDPRLPHYRDFKASGLPYYFPSLTDTIAFVAVAPAGYVITEVRVNTLINQPISRAGRSFASQTMVVGGIATTNAILSGLHAVAVPVSVTIALASAGADVQVVGSTVTVVLAAAALPGPQFNAGQ